LKLSCSKDKVVVLLQRQNANRVPGMEDQLERQFAGGQWRNEARPGSIASILKR
jgi:hypothetical protein